MSLQASSSSLSRPRSSPSFQLAHHACPVRCSPSGDRGLFPPSENSPSTSVSPVSTLPISDCRRYPSRRPSLIVLASLAGRDLGSPSLRSLRQMSLSRFSILPVPFLLVSLQSDVAHACYQGTQHKLRTPHYDRILYSR